MVYNYELEITNYELKDNQLFIIQNKRNINRPARA